MKRFLAVHVSGAGFLTLVCVTAGCMAINRPPAIPYDSAASLFEEAKLTYRVDAGKLQVPVSVARIEGQLVSYEQVPSSLRDRESSGVLEILYPHPNKREGYGLARVTIQSKLPSAIEPPATKSSFTKMVSESARKVPVVGSMVATEHEAEETWELDVPRAQLDRIVTRMNDQRYFERRTTSTETVKILAELDGHEVEKAWNRIDEMDELMVTVRSHGRLVSYKRGEGVDQMAHPPANSVAAYRAYAAQDAAQGGPGSGFLAGGPVLPGVSADPSVPAGYGSVDPRTIAGPGPTMPGAPQLTRLPNVEPSSAR